MTDTLTIVMYHYVRDLPRTRYPRIKGLLTRRFEGQLDYLCNHYHVCDEATIVAASRGETELPPRACWLTFDDGLIDHYVTVLPRLLDRRISGSFFPIVRPALHREVLDVHKLQFVLASIDDNDHLADDVLARVAPFREEHAIPDDETLRRTHTIESRFDPPPVMLVKQLLQHALPPPVRNEIIDALFAAHVSRDATAFADELYMDERQLRTMRSCGMAIGGHGETHAWLEHLPPDRQAAELDATCELLQSAHDGPPHDWVMCYPYGSYNQTTMNLLRERGCRLGVTTRVNLNEDFSAPLELARLDTNDLPTIGDAAPCEWTRKAC